MSIQFVKRVNQSTYLDPASDFALKTVESEIRYDPLTGRISRVFPFRKFALPKHDWTPFVEQSKQRFCPFCPEVLEKVTPKFPADIAPEGRIKIGDVTVVPNLNPYDKYASLVVMSSRHYIPIEEIDAKLIVSSFRAGLDYLQRVTAIDPDGSRYVSMNWNYMPYSGGSIIHPHLQILAGKEPSNYDKELIAASDDYFAASKNNFWLDLVNSELKNGERYLGQTGPVHWLCAFAPRHIGDVIGVLPDKRSIFDVSDDDLNDLAVGLCKVIGYYNQSNISSFNAGLYFANTENRGFAVHARIVGRFTLFPLVGSDFCHMQIMHDDPWTIILPEVIAEELKPYF
jgi:galactose-1-phosphate uridylyltransferase